MPIVSYFSVVGAALLALLLYANATMAPRGPLTLSTNFEGLPPPWVGPAFPQNLTPKHVPKSDVDAEPARDAALFGAIVAAAMTGLAARHNAAEEGRYTTREVAPQHLQRARLNARSLGIRRVQQIGRR